jgi:mRNA-degrading endonuclease RelE of RelBE toxin-antitoxin system
MNVWFTPRYTKEFESLPFERQQPVIDAIQIFTDCIEQKNPLPHSLGVKPFRGTKSKYWEFRSTLADRILFSWESGGVILRFVGSHDDLRKFAKQK